MATAKRKTTHRTNGHLLRSKFKRVLKGRGLKTAATSLTSAAIDAKDTLIDVEENVKKYAKANPWKTMGLTLLAGVVVGQIMNLRK